jgi:hypothetical protein
MDQEKRNGDKPVPDNATQMLNQQQILVLRQVEVFGWRLQFIRRPLLQEPIAVVADGHDMKKIAILEANGRINIEPNISVREQLIS